jgi:arylsulfatase
MNRLSVNSRIAMFLPFVLALVGAVDVPNCLGNESPVATPTPVAQIPDDRPNILVVMVDDLGFSDLGCYGSEIETPNLDRLAQGGVRFTQFYNTAKCHSSRISLLTGRHAYQAGQESLQHASTTAEMLGAAGYHTMMVGKWHLSKQPTEFGFARYFGHLSGACNYYKGDGTFRLNGEKWSVPSEGFYTTVANIDFALQFLKEARSEPARPWYLHVAFNAPHAPLQPMEVDYKKYMGRYHAGWDVVRQGRINKQQALGLFTHKVEASPRPDHIPAWDELTAERQVWEERRMTALAGMIDRVDQEVGRLIGDLEAHDDLNNTLLLFVSDNGACPYDRTSQQMDREPYQADVTWSDSTAWAWARNSPFRFYKQNQHEGGICTPGIVHWPAGLKRSPGSQVDTPLHLVDVLPTLADVTGAPIPDTWPGRELRPVSGISFANVLRGEAMGERPPLYFLFGQDRALRDGSWKLVSFKSNPWELYNLAQDRTELHNLANTETERLQSMVAQWTELSQTVDHAPPKSYAPVLESSTPESLRHAEWTDFEQPLGPIGKHVTEEKPELRKGRPRGKKTE